MPDHPLRPQRPAHPPYAGEDGAAWRAWERACDACRHGSPGGCLEGGAIVTVTGQTRPLLPRVRGGCRGWTPVEGCDNA